MSLSQKVVWVMAACAGLVAVCMASMCLAGQQSEVIAISATTAHVLLLCMAVAGLIGYFSSPVRKADSGFALESAVLVVVSAVVAAIGVSVSTIDGGLSQSAISHGGVVIALGMTASSWWFALAFR